MRNRRRSPAHLTIAMADLAESRVNLGKSFDRAVEAIDEFAAAYLAAKMASLKEAAVAKALARRQEF